MAERMVVGILGECDPKALEAILTRGGLDASRLKIVTKAAPTQAYTDSVLDFVHVGRAQDSNDLADDLTRGTGVMTDYGGTSVPGLSGRHRDIADFTHREHSSGIAGLPIPADQLENFHAALDDGRCIVACPSDETNSPTMESKFREVGARNVQVF